MPTEFEAHTGPHPNRDLEDAVHALIGLRAHTHTDCDGETRSGYRQSVYDELRAELAARLGDGGTLRPRSLPPAWIDALDWLTDIDTTVAAWHPDAGPDNGQPDTVRRLNHLAAAVWSAADHEQLHDWIATLQRWTSTGHALLEPVRRWELVAACPACGVRTVHRPDTSGELVRQAALQITADGCICLSCRTTWAPTHYRILAAALGCRMPPGVLE
ncbi:hypothetical protein IU500_13400 [Nocardia terpenica]|uniref:DUF7341 domain-containing protein n=1 Tax=Nocardia terpenica TaxID=455432 RepID=UPI001894524D|nr:hypothetical protein [Nocardia terpenica]MBF6062827.1 hypothetical protein [Nocardia terpenica]MBF6105038.1 hypothetical protein [Nocardia terpenica]MBF6112525.1 hypothetical protein [Nocardia terpenica]MBF6118766.1 hypothetical protein [Nocardia terpenica]MBF6154235.1 hypothetical protein [Nocardia terpenica]